MKNRVVVLLVSGLLVFSMIGCGSDAKEAQGSDVIVETETQIVENEVESTEVTETEIVDYSDIDYSETLVEVEGGDGTESTEIVESMDVAEKQQTEEAFEPYIMYTNTNCNVRAQASKDSDLVGTAPVNTEIRVVGVEGDWSKVEFNAIQCYIKSSLLSDTKTSKPASGSGSSSSSGSSQTSDSSGGTSSSSDSSSSGSSSGSSQSKQEVADLVDSLFGDGTSDEKAGDKPVTGTTGTVSEGYGGGH